jgi:hypothetical protein
MLSAKQHIPLKTYGVTVDALATGPYPLSHNRRQAAEVTEMIALTPWIMLKILE